MGNFVMEYIGRYVDLVWKLWVDYGIIIPALLFLLAILAMLIISIKS